MPKIIFTESALPFIIKALNIKTDIHLKKIGGFYKGKVYENDLLGVIKLAEDLDKSKQLADSTVV